MNIWEMTDPGSVRKSNQDAYAIRQIEDGHIAVCVVCDGMGGTNGGQVASEMAVQTFMDKMNHSLCAGLSIEEIQELGLQAVHAANEAVRQAALTMENCETMGTTLVATVVNQNIAVIWNVGDSRAYYIHATGIEQISKDHSLVESMVEQGLITHEEARHHPKRNLITRALGPDEMVECDSYVQQMQGQSYLLLCTDGLVETVLDEEIFTQVQQGAQDCLERLLTLAKKRGAPDNLTAVLLQHV